MVERPAFEEELMLAPRRVRKAAADELKNLLHSAQMEMMDDDPDELCSEKVILSRIADFCIKVGVLTKEETEKALHNGNGNGNKSL